MRSIIRSAGCSVVSVMPRLDATAKFIFPWKTDGLYLLIFCKRARIVFLFESFSISHPVPSRSAPRVILVNHLLNEVNSSESHEVLHSSPADSVVFLPGSARAVFWFRALPRFPSPTQGMSA